ncbi:MAG: tryptophan-rich sensory protein [Candidatus Marinimicrobia bacterium]|nr:tryptophan-rich sensory protein [Candidatus Neomarinimicrobiota bacterium]
METAVNNKKGSIIMSVINIVLFLGMVTVNGLANGLPLNGINTGELSALYPNLFVPAGITFSIWALIYLLLLLFVANNLYLSLTGKEEVLIPVKAQIAFALTCLFNAGWIFLWHYKLIFFSLLAMLALLVSLIYLFLRIDEMHIKNIWNRIAVQLPVSIYLGWISVATIANVTALLVSLNWGGWGISENVWTIIMMVAGLILAILMLANRKCIAYSLVFIWAYTGIIIKRGGQEIIHKDIVFTAYAAIVILLILVISTVLKYRKEAVK